MTDPALHTQNLFRHMSADKAMLYRTIMEAFATAKRQFRLHLRPDEVRMEASWQGSPPSVEEIQLALTQLAEWGNLESQPDTARVSSIEDFYRARFLYRLTLGGEAVEAALETFAQALKRRGELQAVALEDILSRLEALRTLAQEDVPDAAKVHEVLRDLVRVFESLAENAQAFMAGVARSIDLQQSDAQAVLAYKEKLISYLDNFIRDLIERSGAIARCIIALAPRIEPMLWQVANREIRDAAPGDLYEQADALQLRLHTWRERWQGLSRWFVSEGHFKAQSETLRSKARAAIPQLLAAVHALNERRSGHSDRSADFRVLASWFADCDDDDDAHRLWRAAFALNPARHLSLVPATEEIPASTRWADAPAIAVHTRLRERGLIASRGPAPHVKPRDDARRLLAMQIAEERAQVEAARAALATGKPRKLSELHRLDAHTFQLFLSLLGEALTAQASPDQPVTRQTMDGALEITLEPLGRDSYAEIETIMGVFAGRDHIITIKPTLDT
jgi:uncharacterized protein (TIGR02677 family)